MRNAGEAAAFGTLLRDLRLAAGLTQAMLAERARLSVRGIQHLERGETRPYRHTVKQLADALQLSPEQRAEFERAAQPAPRRRRSTVLPGPALPPPPALGPSIVTALFVEIESRPSPSPGAAAAHFDRLLHEECVQAHDAVLRPDDGGTTRVLVFARAGEAVTTAIHLRTRLQSEAQALASTGRWRLALHTGEAQQTLGDYHGSVFDQGGRLLAYAQWGQIVLSEAALILAREALRAESLPAFGFRALSDQPTLDPQQPERVFELLPAEGPRPTPSSPAGERKRVTVLCVGIAPMEGMAGAWGAGSGTEIVANFAALVARTVQPYGGVVQRLAEAGRARCVVLFGAPISQEDHAFRALHAALRLQEAAEQYREALPGPWRLLFRVSFGLATGASVVRQSGEAWQLDAADAGSVYRLALWLQAQARSGSICVSEATHQMVGEAFAWRPLGRRVSDGYPEPVQVYELLGTGPAHSRFDVLARRGLTRFVGRERELAQLLTAWERVKRGEGQVVAVIGEAGIGKSRLIHEFKQHLTPEAVTLGETSCFPYGEPISYWPFLDILKAFFSITDRTPEAEGRRCIATHLADLGLAPAEIAPYLYSLLAYPIDDAVFADVPLPLLRRRTVDALKMILLAETRRQPVVLVLEDVHWIDKASGEVLTALVETIATVPLLLVLAYRPEHLHAWTTEPQQPRGPGAQRSGARSAALLRAITAKPHAVRIPLQPLAPERTQALVEDIVGASALPREVERLVANKAGGNPLFVEELTRSIRDSGYLVEQGGRYVLTKPLPTLDLPTTVQDVLLARIDSLAAPLKLVLQVASAIGPVFSYSVLAAAVEDASTLDEHLLKLEDLEFVYPIRLAPECEYSFKHVLTQEAVYGTLLHPQRAAYHERIGRALESLYTDRLEEYYELLAHHYVRSTNTDKAIEYLDRANGKAAKANAMVEAKHYFDQAMQLLDTLPNTTSTQERRIALLVDQPLVFWALLQYKDYYELLLRYRDSAIGLADYRLLAAYYTRLGWSQWTFGYLDEAVRTTAQAVALCESRGHVEDALFAYNTLERCHLFLGNYDQVLQWYEKTLRVFPRPANVRWYAMAASIAAWAYQCQGAWGRAVATAEGALRLGEEAADNGVVSFLNGILCATYTQQRDLVRAVQHGERALATATTPVDLLWAECWLAGARARAGIPQPSAQRLAEILPLVRASGSVPTEIVFTLQLAEAYCLASELANAQTILEKVLVLAESTGMPWYLGAAHRLLGEITLSSEPGARAGGAAGTHFERSIAVLSAIHAENELALAYTGYAQWHQQRGDREAARTYWTRALAIFERLGTLGEPAKVTQALADLPVSRPRESLGTAAPSPPGRGAG